MALNHRARRRTFALLNNPRRKVAVVAKDSPHPMDFAARMASALPLVDLLVLIGHYHFSHHVNLDLLKG